MTKSPMTLYQAFEHNSVLLCAFKASQWYEYYRKYKDTGMFSFLILLYQKNKANI